MNSPTYKAEYMATLKAQVKLQTMNEVANQGSPARSQYVSATSGKGFIPAKISKTKK
jgi:hypothetical protein